MTVHLKALHHKQLDELIQKAVARQQEARKENRVKLRDKILAMIKAEDLSFEDVFPTKGGNAPGRPKQTVAAKYRNPADPGQTWTGRGKRPHWFNAALKAGKTVEDLAV